MLLTGVQSQPLDMLRRISIVPDLIPEARIFESTDACMAWLAAELSARPEAAAPHA